MSNDYTLHPVKAFLEQGIPVTLNSDNQFLGNTTSSAEIDHFVYDLGIDETLDNRISLV
jgi:adenosine deaminase